MVDHDQQRGVILDRSFAVFVARGYGHLSMRDLARETGISFGTLYHYFPKKEILFYSLLERYFNRMFREVPVPQDLGPRPALMWVTQHLEANEQELSGLLTLTLDYIQAQGRPFALPDGQTLDNLLETRITLFLGLSLPHTRLFRQQLIGVLMLRRLTPTHLPLSAALQPLIDLIAPGVGLP